MPATSSGVLRRRAAFFVGISVVLGMLLVACASPAPRPIPDTAAKTPQPVLRPRAIAPERTVAPATIATALPAVAPTHDAPAFIQVAAGENHSCALLQVGRVQCWGANDDGQLDVPEGVSFQRITAGYRFSCGIRTDGEIACWGRNNHQQLDAPNGQFTAIDAGWDHACALSGTDAICWGWNANDRATAPEDVEFTAIAAGAEHSCGLTLVADLICWGKNDNGRAQPRSGPFQSLAAGLEHTCVINSEDKIICQGENASGQSTPPETIFQHISAGADLTCGLLPTGAVECWGGSRWSEALTAERAALPGRYTSVSTGWNGVCAVTEEGYVQCWGYTLSGALFTPYFPTDKVHDFLRHSLELPYHNLTFIDTFPGHSSGQPMEIFDWPSGGMAVVDREGTINVLDRDQWPDIVLDLSDSVDSNDGEKGMLSASLDPDFDNNPFLYVYYSLDDESEKDSQAARARLARFVIADGRVVREEELTILEFIRPAESTLHYGGAIRFGPDGMLYLGVGDSQCLKCPQDLGSLHGKIIRIDVRGASIEQPYRIPNDNPFLEDANARPEIWSYGLRNPWRMSFDHNDGTLWVGDVGRATQEEVSIVKQGANLGWPIFEGVDCYTIPDNASEEVRHILVSYQCSTFEGATIPIIAYGRRWGCPGDSTCQQNLGHHSTIAYGDPPRCAVVGGVVYRGTAIPWLQGTYLFGDHCSGQVWALEGGPNEGWRMIEIVDVDYRLSSFGTDDSGEVYLLTFGGPVLRLVEAES